MSRSKMEPPPPPPLPSVSNPSTRKRHFGSGSSSPPSMDPDVVEIPPLINHPSRSSKQKQDVSVIHIGDDDDVMIIGEKVGKSNKGKKIEAIHDGYGSHQPVEMSHYTSNGYPSVSHDDDYMDLFYEDYVDVDDYTSLQAHFDNLDVPPGVEAPITWLPEYDAGLKQTGNSLFYVDSFQPSWPLEPTNPETLGSSVGGSNLQIKMVDIDHSSGTNLSSPQLFSQASPSKKKSVTSQRRGRDLSMSSGVESSKSQRLLPCQSKKKPAISGASINHGFIANSEVTKLPPASEPPFWSKFKSAGGSGSGSLYHSSFFGHDDGSFHPSGIESGHLLKNSQNFKPFFTNYTSNPTVDTFTILHAPSEYVLGNTSVHNSAREVNNGDVPVVTISNEIKDEILRKFESFKQFDTVEDASDHYFVGQNSSMKQHPKNWAKKIQEEWKILEKDLPDSIFVRVYESRMDLLRAVIIGAEGTPYHDGLFFFDVFFPSGYPNVPPKVHYHSGGLRLNPNLYNCGKVCLSLLNTWSGGKNEKWLPGVSTILQVLVSIQGLILNAKPYFNEPGYAHMSGSKQGELTSLKYNEDTFILSLKTMMYMMRRPPKYFEGFVAGYFCSRAQDILVACKAYMEGAQVGCLVKGGVQDVDEGDKSCSKNFKDSLAGYVNMITKEFANIGAKERGKFQSPATTLNKPLGGLPVVAT